MTIKQLDKKLDEMNKRIEKAGNTLAIIKNDFEKFQIVDSPSICPRCQKKAVLNGSWQHMFGTEPVCSDCNEEPTEAKLEMRRIFSI